MDQNAKFLIDECLSRKLVPLLQEEYGVFATRVPWLGVPPREDSWQDEDIAAKIGEDDYVFVTNNRKHFVGKHYPEQISIHSGLVIFLKRTDIDGDIFMMCAVMDFLTNYPDTVNKLIEVDTDGNVTISDWPDASLSDPWSDPMRR